MLTIKCDPSLTMEGILRVYQYAEAGECKIVLLRSLSIERGRKRCVSSPINEREGGGMMSKVFFLFGEGRLRICKLECGYLWLAGNLGAFNIHVAPEAAAHTKELVFF